jgi:hypothetical protein
MGRFRDVYLGDYEDWSQTYHAEVLQKELGWKAYQRQGSPVAWDKVDCLMEPVRLWQGWLKHGSGHAMFTLSKLVREGRISREDALELAQNTDGKKPIALVKELEAEIGVENFDAIIKGVNADG